MIKEELLHYIWQYQLFDRTHLHTEEGIPITLLKTGTLNTHSGPDFENSRLLIGELEWVGKVEVHIKASDWLKHNHTDDPAYDSVILHVVWENDIIIKRKDGSIIPALSLKGRVKKELLEKFILLKESQLKIPCETFFASQSQLNKFSMLEKALAKRLERKAALIVDLYDKLKHDFEETAYRTLLQNFGFKLNAEPFLQLAQSLPQKILAKHRGNLFQIEALLFGQAGFLKDSTTEYAQKLKKEYDFLAHKYSLQQLKMQRMQWRFLRTRPQSFPTVRIAQLAAYINNNSNFFSYFIEKDFINSKNNLLDFEVSEYWKNNYDWGKKTNKPNQMGKASFENILINTVVPILAAYYKITDDYAYFEKAVQILEKLPPENNYITRIWKDLGLPCKSAFDSQAMIEQYNELCQNKKCLECIIGNQILRNQEN